MILHVFFVFFAFVTKLPDSQLTGIWHLLSPLLENSFGNIRTMIVDCLVIQALFNSYLTWPRQHLTLVIQASSGFKLPSSCGCQLVTFIGINYISYLYNLLSYSEAIPLGEIASPWLHWFGEGILPTDTVTVFSIRSDLYEWIGHFPGIIK